MLVQGTFEKRCLAVEAPTELSFITASVSLLVTLTNIPGNILIILAVVLDPNKNLRTPFNLLIVNLATADLIVGTMTNPISVYVHTKEGLGRKVTLADTSTIHVTYFISCTASVLSLSSLAVERYLAIRKPNTYRTGVTNKRIGITVAAIWMISLSLPILYFEVGSSTYAFIFANTSVAVAIAITCLTYTLMLRTVKARSQQMTHNNMNIRDDPNINSGTSSSQGQSLSTVSPNNNSPNSIINSARQIEAKVTKMFIVVLIAMLCSYGPSTIFIYIMNFCESCSCITLHWFRDLQFLFVIVNSSVNFYCYALQCSRFRSAFTKILKIKRRRSGAETSFSNINNTPTASISNTVQQDVQQKTHEGNANDGLDITPM